MRLLVPHHQSLFEISHPQDNQYTLLVSYLHIALLLSSSVFLKASLADYGSGLSP